MKSLLAQFKLDQVVGLDAETYFDKEYSLKNPKLGTTDYIIDDRFKLHCMSMQTHRMAKAKVLSEKQLIAWAKTVNWKRTGVLAHHAQFDGLILSHHYGIKPAAFFDTKSMAKPLLPIQVGGGLDAIDKSFGGVGKEGGEILDEIKGLRVLTADQYKRLAFYAGGDIEKTWFIFHKMREYLPLRELELIDRTVRMYTDPTLLVDKTAIEQVRANDRANKVKLVKALKIDKDPAIAAKSLSSDAKFAALLEDAGIVVPMKLSDKKSAKAGRQVMTYAFSKQDQEFKDLQSHESKRVRQLMDARFAVSSTLMEARCTRLAERSRIGAQPVYLNYYGAKPGRWSGGDLVNFQNLSSKRKDGGAELRASVYAPPGYVLLIADLGQIEARLNAWDSGQVDIVERFAAGEDVYRYVAAGIFNVPIDKVTDGQRFIAKTCVLALGYQAGAPRFGRTCRIGAFGPAIDMSDSLAKDIHTAWRSTNNKIVNNWRTNNNNLKSAFLGCQKIQQGVVTYEGVAGGKGFIHGPGGMAVRFDGVSFDGEGIKYISEYFVGAKGGIRTEYTRLYGGIIQQNKIEHLGRRIIADQMLELCEYLPTAKLVMSTHDEIVMAVPIRLANKALKAANAIMSRSPYWAPDLPLAVDAHISSRYDK